MRDKIAMWVAWHLPRDVAANVFVRVYVTVLGDRTMGELSAMDALKEWLNAHKAAPDR
jgi:hypothetical protein